MNTRRFQFGDYDLDIPRRELRHLGHTVDVQLKVFDTLAWLVEHRERAVGRDELIAAVWGKVDVSDNVLGQIIGRARHVVGDDGNRQHSIRTVPRFGYRWVAATEPLPALPDSVEGETRARPVDDLSEPASGKPASAAVTTAARPQSRRINRSRQWTFAVLLGVSLVALLGFWRYRTQVQAADSGALVPAGMVLPVRTEPHPEYAWMRLGVADYIAERLRGRGQVVMPTETMVALSHGWRGAEPDPGELAALQQGGTVGVILRSRATRVGGDWLVEITNLADAEPAAPAIGRAADVLVAASIAVDRFLPSARLLSKPTQAGEEQLSLGQLLQRVRAATLADDLEQAQRLLDQARPELSLQPEVILERAQVELAAGQVQGPLAKLTTLSADPRIANDKVRRARVFHVLGQVRFQRFEFDLAQSAYDQAVALLTPSENPQQSNLLGRLLISRGRLALQRHQLAAAELDHANARLALEASGDQVGLARLNNNQANLLLYERNQPEAARPLMAKVADQARSFHDVSGEARARITLLSIERLLLDAGPSGAHFARLQELDAQIADPSLRQLARLMLARSLIDQGQLSAARAILQANGRPTSENADPALVQLAHALRAQLEWSAGRYAQAESAARKALGAQLADADIREYALAWLAGIRAQRALGRFAEADEWTSGLQEFARQSTGTLAQIYAQVATAEAATPRFPDRADANWQQAQAQAIVLRVPFDQLQVAESYAIGLIDRGQLKQAVPVVDRVAAYASTQFNAAMLQLRLYHALAETEAWARARERARKLAGERSLPDALVIPPVANRR